MSDLYFRTDLENDSTLPTDTTDCNVTIRYWLNRVQTLTAKYDLIENYFAANELTAAQNMLDSIPYNFRLSEDQLSAYNNYVYFYNFKKGIFENERDMSQLDENEIQQLVNFSEDGNDFAKVMAQNVLCFYYNICSEMSYDVPSNGNKSFNNPKTNSIQSNNVVTVVPNPALTYTIFRYLFPSLQENAVLVIADVTGRVMQQFTLTRNEGQQIWETRNVNKGLYYYSIKSGNSTLAKGKVAVAK